MLSKRKIKQIGKIIYYGTTKDVDTFVNNYSGAVSDLLDMPPLLVLFDEEKRKKTPLNNALEIAWETYKKILESKKENE